MESLTAFAWGWTALAVLVGAVLLRRPAPYGRHRSGRWGPTLPHRVGWITMELVSPAALVASIALAPGHVSTGASVLVVCWLGHYAYRAVVFPFRARWKGRRMPVVVMLMAIVFNTVNGGLNGWALASMRPDGAALAIGLALWTAGLLLNVHSDEILRSLRSGSSATYGIPKGGFFRWVSCPNYLGEIVEWTGFAIAAWNPAALSFAVWTAANLLPRALSHHRWYLDRFPDYPARRRALVPGVL